MSACVGGRAFVCVFVNRAVLVLCACVYLLVSVWMYGCVVLCCVAYLADHPLAHRSDPMLQSLAGRSSAPMPVARASQHRNRQRGPTEGSDVVPHTYEPLTPSIGGSFAGFTPRRHSP